MWNGSHWSIHASMLHESATADETLAILQQELNPESKWGKRYPNLNESLRKMASLVLVDNPAAFNLKPDRVPTNFVRWFFRNLKRLGQAAAENHEDKDFMMNIYWSPAGLRSWDNEPIMILGAWREALDLYEQLQKRNKPFNQQLDITSFLQSSTFDWDGKPVFQASNGYKVWHLPTVDDLKQEGKLMRHCIGGGTYNTYACGTHDWENAYHTAFSIRDADDRPRATIVYDGKEPKQFYGLRDGDPEDAAKVALQEFDNEKMDGLYNYPAYGFLDEYDDDEDEEEEEREPYEVTDDDAWDEYHFPDTVQEIIEWYEQVRQNDYYGTDYYQINQFIRFIRNMEEDQEDDELHDDGNGGQFYITRRGYDATSDAMSAAGSVEEELDTSLEEWAAYRLDDGQFVQALAADLIIWVLSNNRFLYLGTGRGEGIRSIRDWATDKIGYLSKPLQEMQDDPYGMQQQEENLQDKLESIISAMATTVINTNSLDQVVGDPDSIVNNLNIHPDQLTMFAPLTPGQQQLYPERVNSPVRWDMGPTNDPATGDRDWQFGTTL